MIQEKKQKRKEMWERYSDSDEFMEQWDNLRSTEERNSFKKRIDQQIREKIGLNNSIIIKNLLTSEFNKFRLGSDIKVSKMIKHLFTREVFLITENVGELNRRFHKEILRNAK